MNEQPFYDTGKIRHSAVGHSFRVQARHLNAEYESEHAGLEIIFVPSEQRTPGCTLRVDGKVFVLAPGDMLIYNGRMPHVDVHLGRSDALAVVISEPFVVAILNDVGIAAHDLAFAAQKAHSSPLLRSALALLFATREATPCAASSHFWHDGLFTALAIEALAAQPHNASERLRRAQATGHYPSAGTRAKRFIMDNLDDEGMSVDDVARASGLSKFHLIRTFRQVAGMSPMRFRSILRVELARSRLQKPGATVTGVATDLGYGDLSTFTKAYRRCFGRAPGCELHRDL